MKTDLSALLLTFDKVYGLYYKKVLNYLISIVGKAYAEDIAQETFIKIHKSLHSLKDESKLASWVYKIALNSARDRMRKESKSKNVTTLKIDLNFADLKAVGADTSQIYKDSNTIEEKIFRSEMIGCYISFVKKLPKNYYQIYLLSSFDNLSNKEISKVLSLPIDTVKIRLHRAKVKLYEELRANCHCYQNEHGELAAELKH